MANVALPIWGTTDSESDTINTSLGPPLIGTVGAIHDGDTSTGCGVNGRGYSPTLTMYLNLAIPYLIASVVVTYSVFGVPGYTNSLPEVPGAAGFTLYLYYGGAWHSIFSDGVTNGNKGTLTATITGPWAGVTAVEVACGVDGLPGNDPPSGGQIVIYEVVLSASPYADSHLRVKTANSGTVALATFLPGSTQTSPIKAKNSEGIVYIAITTPTDFYASPVRVFVKGQIYALAKYTGS
jgi:hypothetical protein